MAHKGQDCHRSDKVIDVRHTMNKVAKVKHFYLTFSRPSLEHGHFRIGMSPETSDEGQEETSSSGGRVEAAYTEGPSEVSDRTGGQGAAGLPVETLR